MSNSKTKTETAFQAIDRIAQARDALTKPSGEEKKEPYAWGEVRCCKKTIDAYAALKEIRLSRDPECGHDSTRLICRCRSFSDISRELGDKIERLRFKNRLTIREIARRIHKSERYVSDVLKYYCIDGNRRLRRKGFKKAS